MNKLKTPFLIIIFALVGCTLSPSIANQRTIDILQVTKIGPSISIFLDYNLNSTSQLDSNESLVVLVVFSQDNPFIIEAAMLFFHTAEDQYFLFWMLGDPYTQAQNWILGLENEHFQTDNELLILNFIEFLKISDPAIHPIVLALITSTYEVSNQTNDFQPILGKFIAYLPVHYEFPSFEESEFSSEETTETQGEKTSEEGGPTPGFVFLSTLGVFLSIPIAARLKRQK